MLDHWLIIKGYKSETALGRGLVLSCPHQAHLSPSNFMSTNPEALNPNLLSFYRGFITLDAID